MNCQHPDCATSRVLHSDKLKGAAVAYVLLLVAFALLVILLITGKSEEFEQMIYQPFGKIMIFCTIMSVFVGGATCSAESRDAHI